MSNQRAQWGSRLGFVLAAAGSAVGLGNIWKFPYITGENGGGLFVLIYLLCIALVGIPIMVSEILIGRASQRQPVAAFHVLQGRRSAWAGVGWLGVIAGFVILSYYVVVAGWAMDYTLKSVINFTRPMHEKAEADATSFIATAPPESIMSLLVERKAAHDARTRLDDIRREVAPSVWKNHARFDAAVSKAPDQAEARRRLLLDPALAADIKAAESRLARLEQAEAEAKAEASTYYAAMPATALLEEAKAAKRRELMAAGVNDAFGATATDGWTSTFWSALFMMATIVIVAAGISSGIERACRVMMPLLLLILLGMVGYGVFQPGFPEAFRFVFHPDPGRLKPSGVLEALGHAFFTLSLGMGAMITYGSYQRSREGGILGQAMWIAVLDTAVALLACGMMFPIIFSYGQEPSAGPGLVFKSMPLAFAEIGAGGMLLAIMFFGLLVFAALTSSISLLEVVASYFMDEHGWSRARAAWGLGLVIFLFSLPSAFAYDSSFAMSGWSKSYGLDFFDSMDYLASNWMLPLGGLFIALYAGWVMPKRLRNAELEDMAPVFVLLWLLLIRFVAPVLVVVVLLQKVGIIDADELFFKLTG
ncbi:MAG: sodium-dependent transporter [Phycisphaerales bacterium]|nr:sodium-dependent transporter [Phycisphaerales bacterium]